MAACVHPHRGDASNALLAQLAYEDQAVQRGVELTRSSEDRVRLVLAELTAGRLVTPEDEFRAALVLDHSPMTIRDSEVVAVSPDNYLVAHYLAKRSYERGYADARLLVAQTLDRYMSVTEGYQKYGTNRFINQRTGQEELAPIDRRTTDQERAEYGVPPLAELLRRYPEAKRRRP